MVFIGCGEARVLKARLQSMNLECSSCEDDPVSGIEIPLSDEPLPDIQGSLEDSVENATGQWQATPAGPLQTVTISNKEFLETWKSGGPRLWKN